MNNFYTWHILKFFTDILKNCTGHEKAVIISVWHFHIILDEKIVNWIMFTCDNRKKFWRFQVLHSYEITYKIGKYLLFLLEMLPSKKKNVKSTVNVILQKIICFIFYKKSLWSFNCKIKMIFWKCDKKYYNFVVIIQRCLSERIYIFSLKIPWPWKTLCCGCPYEKNLHN